MAKAKKTLHCPACLSTAVMKTRIDGVAHFQCGGCQSVGRWGELRKNCNEYAVILELNEIINDRLDELEDTHALKVRRQLDAEVHNRFGHFNNISNVPKTKVLRQLKFIQRRLEAAIELCNTRVSGEAITNGIMDDSALETSDELAETNNG